MSVELSEQIFNAAVQNLSWTNLKKHLAGINWKSDEVEKMLGLMRRNDSLVLKRENLVQEKKRDCFLCELAKEFDERGFAEAAELTRYHNQHLKDIDNVYQNILNQLKNSAVAEMVPELRVAALLDRSNHDHIDLYGKINKLITQENQVDINLATIPDENGIERSIDGIHEMIVSTFASTLSMEAYINKWYDTDGMLILPSLPLSNEENRCAVGRVQYLAVAWRHWQTAERRYRYLGGELAMNTNLPSTCNQTPITNIWTSMPNDDNLEFYHYLANNRLLERFTQHLMAMSTTASYKAGISGIEGPVDLLPAASISLEEIHGATSLSQLLSGDICADLNEYAGLTFREWVRGYSILQVISKNALNANDPNCLTIRYMKPELVAILKRLGLDKHKAEIFIKHVSYGKASRDMFDQPLIQMQDGSIILVSFACATTSIPNVVLSTLGMLKVNLEKRGKQFEKYMIQFLEKRGFKAKNINCNRGGETFDYDVAFVWGDYLFLLECKSRGLSGGDPSIVYYFSLGVREVVAQVKRLANGLKRYPDIIATHFPEAVGKKVVHCVVNSLPFAMFGCQDDIYFTDESSFTRFFLQSEIGGRRIRPGDSSLGDIDQNEIIASLWKETTPTPEDLLRQLETPIQLVMAIAHSELSPVVISLDEKKRLALFQYGRKNCTLDEYRTAARDAGY